MISEIKSLFDEWIAAVAGAVNFGIGRYARGRQILLSEHRDRSFAARLKSERKDAGLPEVSFCLADGWPDPPLPADWVAAFRGSRVEAEMTSGQLLFRSLDFPKQAVDFLDGMIRTQIDRLTPWTADDVVFGWSLPTAIPNDRVELTLASTSRQEIQPLVQFASNMAAASIAGFAMPPAAGGVSARIKVFDQPVRAAGRATDVPRMLRVALLSAGIAAAASVMATAYVGSNLDSDLQQLMRRISERRASLRLNPNTGSALSLLAKRKQTSPSSVVVLEALSQALPDGTFATEVRIEGDKVQVVGMTRDAPSLIRLIEKSPQFARATFFAPTTRAQNEPGERFHIEAQITPSFGSGS